MYPFIFQIEYMLPVVYLYWSFFKEKVTIFIEEMQIFSSMNSLSVTLADEINYQSGKNLYPSKSKIQDSPPDREHISTCIRSCSSHLIYLISFLVHIYSTLYLLTFYSRDTLKSTIYRVNLSLDMTLSYPPLCKSILQVL